MNWILLAGGILALSLLSACRSPGGQDTASGPAVTGAQEIPASQLKDWMTSAQPFTLIDVRGEKEWQTGHAASAIHIPLSDLAGRISTAVPDKTARIVFCCLSGKRSAAAVRTLRSMGYSNVYSLAGGLLEYQRAGLPFQR